MTRIARKRSTASARALAGVDELLADGLDVADRREAAAEVGEPLERRDDGPLAERVEQLLVADVLDLVALELAQRRAHDGLLVGLGGERVDDEGDDAADADDAEETDAFDGEQHREPSASSDLDLDDLEHPDEPDDHHDDGHDRA